MRLNDDERRLMRAAVAELKIAGAESRLLFPFRLRPAIVRMVQIIPPEGWRGRPVGMR